MDFGNTPAGNMMMFDTFVRKGKHTRYSDSQWQLGSVKIDPKVRKIQVLMQLCRNQPQHELFRTASCWSVRIGLG